MAARGDPVNLLPPLDRAGADLPVRPALAELVSRLREQGTAVLVAPPGSGKTTLLPLALADAGPGRVLLAEPRRIATRAAARRMAELVREPVGRRIGYSMRGDRQVSADTRVEVVTTGLLVRRLQADPDLDGVRAVVLDEVHERQLDTDLALAFLLDVRANLRPDLQLVGTSATADSERLARRLGGSAPAPVVSADGRLFPVQVHWTPPDRVLPLLPDARVNPRLLDHVAATVRGALTENAGDILVFLPGEAEIGALAGRLDGSIGARVQRLYGRLSAAEQDDVLRPGGERRVVLATAVAESSLTVPGVRIVVDAGLSREPRIDPARGLGSLRTVRVSRSSATQRAGRAGRQRPGVVYRCWAEAEHRHLAEQAEPEINTSDLTGFALAVAAWGHPAGVGLALLDPPPAPALTAAVDALTALGALDGNGAVTAKGRRLADIPAEPRLARALIDGAELVGSARAAELVALLSLEERAGTDDLSALWRNLRSGRDAGATARWRQEVARLRRSAGSVGGGRFTDDLAAATVIALAFPERLAVRRGDGFNYLTAGGVGAALDTGTTLAGQQWLAIAVADRPAGRADARIRLAAPLDEATARARGAGLLRIEDEILWERDDLVLRQGEYLGAIRLTERPLTSPDADQLIETVRDGLRRSGLRILTFTANGSRLRERMAFCHRSSGPPWPDVSDRALIEDLDWLTPDLMRVRRRGDLSRIDTTSALRRLLPWPAAAQLDQLAPEQLTLPGGATIRLDYPADGPPVVEVRVQQLFGLTRTPMVNGRPVLLHLLSPARRPVAVTADLASFWRQGYPQVRAEQRSRYPRHPWPEDPSTAPPATRGRP